MTAIYLNEQDVRPLITVKECIPLVEEAMRWFGLGVAVNQPRRRLRSQGFTFQMMVSVIAPMGVAGHKTGGNPAAYGGARAGAAARAATGGGGTRVHLYSTQTGELLAVMDAGNMGQVRTGSATGVAAKYQARQDAHTVGIIGSGHQAGTQLEALCAVREIRSVKVYSRTAEHAAAYARQMSDQLGIPVTPVATAEEAAKADIVVCITNAQQPVLQGAWLEPGTFLTAAGGNSLIRGEIDAEAVRRAAIVTADSVEDARLESADLMRAVEAGAINWEQVRELGHVVAGLTPGRTNDDEITLFESHGLALWDIAAAGLVYEKAKAQGLGAPLPF